MSLDGPFSPPSTLIDTPNDEQDDFYTDNDLFNIQSWGADLSFRELISRYDDDELVKPELQRNYVWDKSEASRFIDSILLGLPVPSIFLAKTSDEKLLIIDGFQRLMSVRDFVKGIFSKDDSLFRLSRTEKIHERWRGKSFNELDSEQQRKIRNTTIHAIIFMQRQPSNDDTSLFQVFERINSSGRILLPQEIRNCVYQGPMNSLIMDLNKNVHWRALFGKETPDDRMRDVEFILRFFALSDDSLLLNEQAPSRISLKKYLNQYMSNHNEDDKIIGFRAIFEDTMSFIYNVFGENAFHNLSPTVTGQYVPRFSPTVFDAIAIACRKFIEATGYNSSHIDIQQCQQNKLVLLGDESYQFYLSQETMRTPHIKKRVDTAYMVLFGD